MSILKNLILLSAFISSSAVVHNDVVVLEENNFVTLRGPITGQSASKFINQLISKTTAKGHANKDLYIYLNTNGGSVTSGMQIVQSLKALELSGTKITCIGNVALSMGFVIMQYCPNRYVLDSSVLMQHQMSLGTEGQYENVVSYMNFIKQMGGDIDRYQAERIGLTLESFKDKTRHDWWLFGNNSVINNVADKLVHVTCDFKPEVEVEKFQSFFGDVSVHFSKCPVAKDPLKVEFSIDPKLGSGKSLQSIQSETDKFYISNYIQEIAKGGPKDGYVL